MNIIGRIRREFKMTLVEFSAVLGIEGKYCARRVHQIENLQRVPFKYVRRVVKWCRDKKHPLDEGALFD